MADAVTSIAFIERCGPLPPPPPPVSKGVTAAVTTPATKASSTVASLQVEGSSWFRWRQLPPTSPTTSTASAGRIVNVLHGACTHYGIEMDALEQEGPDTPRRISFPSTKRAVWAASEGYHRLCPIVPSGHDKACVFSHHRHLRAAALCSTELLLLTGPDKSTTYIRRMLELITMTRWLFLMSCDDDDGSNGQRRRVLAPLRVRIVICAVSGHYVYHHRLDEAIQRFRSTVDPRQLEALPSVSVEVQMEHNLTTLHHALLWETSQKRGKVEVDPNCAVMLEALLGKTTTAAAAGVAAGAPMLSALPGAAAGTTEAPPSTSQILCLSSMVSQHCALVRILRGSLGPGTVLQLPSLEHGRVAEVFPVTAVPPHSKPRRLDSGERETIVPSTYVGRAGEVVYVRFKHHSHTQRLTAGDVYYGAEGGLGQRTAGFGPCRFMQLRLWVPPRRASTGEGVVGGATGGNIGTAAAGGGNQEVFFQLDRLTFHEPVTPKTTDPTIEVDVGVAPVDITLGTPLFLWNGARCSDSRGTVVGCRRPDSSASTTHHQKGSAATNEGGEEEWCLTVAFEAPQHFDGYYDDAGTTTQRRVLLSVDRCAPAVMQFDLNTRRRFSNRLHLVATVAAYVPVYRLPTLYGLGDLPWRQRLDANGEVVPSSPITMSPPDDVLPLLLWNRLRRLQWMAVDPHGLRQQRTAVEWLQTIRDSLSKRRTSADGDVSVPELEPVLTAAAVRYVDWILKDPTLPRHQSSLTLLEVWFNIDASLEWLVEDYIHAEVLARGTSKPDSTNSANVLGGLQPAELVDGGWLHPCIMERVLPWCSRRRQVEDGEDDEEASHSVAVASASPTCDEPIVFHWYEMVAALATTLASGDYIRSYRIIYPGVSCLAAMYRESVTVASHRSASWAGGFVWIRSRVLAPLRERNPTLAFTFQIKSAPPDLHLPGLAAYDVDIPEYQPLIMTLLDWLSMLPVADNMKFCYLSSRFMEQGWMGVFKALITTVRSEVNRYPYPTVFALRSFVLRAAREALRSVPPLIVPPPPPPMTSSSPSAADGNEWGMRLRWCVHLQRTGYRSARPLFSQLMQTVISTVAITRFSQFDNLFSVLQKTGASPAKHPVSICVTGGPMLPVEDQLAALWCFSMQGGIGGSKAVVRSTRDQIGNMLTTTTVAQDLKDDLRMWALPQTVLPDTLVPGALCVTTAMQIRSVSLMLHGRLPAAVIERVLLFLG